MSEKIKVCEGVLTYGKVCRKKGEQQKHVAFILETTLTRARFVPPFVGMIYVKLQRYSAEAKNSTTFCVRDALCSKDLFAILIVDRINVAG